MSYVAHRHPQADPWRGQLEGALADACVRIRVNNVRAGGAIPNGLLAKGSDGIACGTAYGIRGGGDMVGVGRPWDMEVMPVD